MRKKIALTFTISVLVVYAVLLTLLFLLLPQTLREHTIFALSLAFFLGSGLLMTGYIVREILRGGMDTSILLPPLLRFFLLGNLFFLAAGALFLCLLPDIKLVLAVDLVAAAAYFLLVFLYRLPVRAVRAQREIRDRDVRLVDGWQSTVELYADMATDRDCAQALRRLAEDLRYSDHVSYGALHTFDSALDDRIRAMQAILVAQPKEEQLAEIQAVRLLVKERQARCLQLK